jgi:hypothetical protein
MLDFDDIHIFLFRIIKFSLYFFQSVLVIRKITSTTKKNERKTTATTKYKYTLIFKDNIGIKFLSIEMNTYV